MIIKIIQAWQILVSLFKRKEFIKLPSSDRSEKVVYMRKSSIAAVKELITADDKVVTFVLINDKFYTKTSKKAEEILKEIN